MVSGVGDLTFTGIVFSWVFSLTGRRTDQELELQVHAVQNCSQVVVQVQVLGLLYPSKPHQSMHPTLAVAWTWHRTLQGSYLQTHHCRVSSERTNLAYNATKPVCLAHLIHPRKLWNIQLLQEKKPTLKMVQQQHLQVIKFIIIKSPFTFPIFWHDGTLCWWSENGLDHRWCPPLQIYKMENYMWKHPWLQTSYPSREC